MSTPKRYGPNTEWTKQELHKLKILSMNHSSSEIAEIIGRTKGSIQAQAARMGIKFQNDNTATAFAKRAETFANSFLSDSILMTKEDYHCPYDIIWENKKINVKAATLRYNRFAHCWYWDFRIKDHWKNCDMFLFLGYLEDSEFPKKIWLIPSGICNKGSIGMSQTCRKSKYTKYEIKERLN